MRSQTVSPHRAQGCVGTPPVSANHTSLPRDRGRRKDFFPLVRPIGLMRIGFALLAPGN